MNQPEFNMDGLPPKKVIKGWCACGAECDCELRRFSDGTLHLHGTCPQCGKTDWKYQFDKTEIRKYKK